MSVYNWATDMGYKAASSVRRFIVLSTVLSVLGCQDMTVKLPAGAVRSDFYQSEEAAYRMVKGARFEFQRTLLEFMRTSGGFSDELRFTQYGRELGDLGNTTNVTLEIDSRYVPETRVGFGQAGLPWPADFGGYKSLQSLRSQTLQARMSLQKYAKDAPSYVVGEMLLYEGLAVVMLADLFCSGVPLSIVDFERDFTYRPGLSTPDLYRHAIALFDTAIAMTVANDSLYYAAKAGKARAHLALAEYGEADNVVSGVSTFVEFKLPIATLGGAGGVGSDWSANPQRWKEEFRVYSPNSVTGLFNFVADKEGLIGLPYLSEKDPRVAVDSSDEPTLHPRTNRYGYPNRFPKGRTHLTVGSYLEVQLIKSEVLLNRNDPQWLIVLNTLRTNGTYSVSEGGDTVWNAGIGGIVGLRPLVDPGNDIARVNLLFKERAYWLFFTGRRQGDMRRLVRNYQRPLESVYPMGTYEGGNGEFWPYMNLPIPDSERVNPLFSGCFGRDI